MNPLHNDLGLTEGPGLAPEVLDELKQLERAGATLGLPRITPTDQRIKVLCQRVIWWMDMKREATHKYREWSASASKTDSDDYRGICQRAADQYVQMIGFCSYRKFQAIRTLKSETR